SLAGPGADPIEAGHRRGPWMAGHEAHQHETETLPRLDGACRRRDAHLRAPAEIGRGEAALPEIREDRAAHDLLAHPVAVDGHGHRLDDVTPDLRERSSAGQDVEGVGGEVSE